MYMYNIVTVLLEYTVRLVIINNVLYSAQYHSIQFKPPYLVTITDEPTTYQILPISVVHHLQYFTMTVLTK